MTRKPPLGSANIEIDYKGLTTTLVLCAFIVGWAKLALVQQLGLASSVIPVAMMFGALAYYNPTVAVALFFGANYLLGQLSIAHYPSVSVLTATAGITFTAVLARRWREGDIAGSLWGRNRLARIGLCLVLCVWILGVLSSTYRMLLSLSQDHSTLRSLFDGGARGANDLLPIVTISHWYLFISLGVLAIWEKRDVRIFLLALSFAVTLQLVAIPWSTYKDIFENIYIKCYPMGLSYANVNRSHVGYLFATASAVAMVYAPQARGPLKWGLYAWWGSAAWVMVLAGSKGPVLAWFLTMALVTIVSWKKGRKEKLFVLILTLGTLTALNFLLANRPFPCGTSLQYQIAKHSVTTRLGNIKESIKDERAGMGDWWLGKGIGASTRSQHPSTQKIVTHSGTTDIFFDLLEDVGVVGLCLFVMGVSLLAIGFFRAYPVTQEDNEDALAIAAMLAIFVIQISVATETYTEDSFALAVGLIYSAAKFRSSSAGRLRVPKFKI